MSKIVIVTGATSGFGLATAKKFKEQGDTVVIASRNAEKVHAVVEEYGLAAAVCKEYGCTPREVYTHHLKTLKERMTQGVSIPDAFCCEVGEEEKYHYRDLGWVHIYPTQDWDETYTEKFRSDIQHLGIEHKFPLPDELKT